MLIRQAELEGELVDVRLESGRVAETSEALAPRPGETVVEAKGGALLPGLHDHHIHLNATAAALGSVRCGPPEVRNASDLAKTLHAAPGEGWLRGIGYHDSVAGEIDRAWLDRFGPARPIRIQHRSGRMWIVNGLAAEALGAGVPRDGRLLDRDEWLRARLDGAGLGGAGLDLRPVGASLARLGVTGLTEVTPRNVREDYHRYAEAGLPQRLRVMGRPALAGAPATGLAEVGEVKLHHHDHDLPALDDLVAEVAAAHGSGRAVASHCVTVAELMMTLAAIEEAGYRPGDRIEHAGIVTPDLRDRMAALGVTVVSQPHFLAERGEAYRADVDPAMQRWLYPLGGLARAGIPIAAGSDAPFGGLDPWASMAAAVDRPAGFGEDEALTPEQALALYTGRAGAPGGPARRVHAGETADLCLIDRPWRDARAGLADVRVAATWVGAALVYRA